MKKALVLSGGGSRGAYQAGVIKALRELDHSFDIVTGTSVGAINGALVAQNDYELLFSLWEEITTDMVFDLDADDAFSYIIELFRKGGVTAKGLRGLLDRYIDEDKIRSSGTDFGLVTVKLSLEDKLSSVELMKDDIPRDQLVMYLMASAACFPAIKWSVIGGATYIDGGYSDNLPIKLAKSAGAEEFIAVELNSFGLVDKKVIDETPNVTTLRSSWELGNFLIFERDNSKKLLDLGYLETMKHYGRYSGKDYIFETDSYHPVKMRGADEAGRIFNIYAAKAYSKDEFDRLLLKAARPYLKASDIKQTDILHKLNPLTDGKAYIAALALLLSKNNKALLSKLPMSVLKEDIIAANYINKISLISGDEK